MTDTATHTRQIPDRLTSRATRVFRSWEALLLAVAIAIFIVNSFASPYFRESHDRLRDGAADHRRGN